MNNYLKLYWLTKLDYMQGLSIIIIILSIIGLIIYYVSRGTAGDWHYGEENKQAKASFLKAYKWIPKVCYSLLITASLVITFIPSKTDMILIYAGGKTMDFVQSDTSLSKIPFQTTKIISDYLEKQIKDNK